MSKELLLQALQQFPVLPLAEAGRRLLNALGYQSERMIDVHGTAEFLDQFDPEGQFDREKSLLDDWVDAAFLMQVTDDEVNVAQPRLAFNSAGSFKGNNIDSFVFIAVHLRGPTYTRGQLAGLAREVNRLFPMPVALLIRAGDGLTLSVTHRRPHRVMPERDVLERVTLIRDIRFEQPHRSHLDILHELSLTELEARGPLHNFTQLQSAWETVLDISALNRRFFRELQDWYFWALKEARWPQATEAGDATSAQATIRLITRVIFVWFLREKNLMPPRLFEPALFREVLREDTSEQSLYYKAILQNLFFGALATETSHRHVATSSEAGQNAFRYPWAFRAETSIPELFSEVPFLNGGLFECLDGHTGCLDGFSDEDTGLQVPDHLFFGEEHAEDLSQTFGERYGTKVRGLFSILNRYKFTVDENTPVEQEAALDPELLGRVFENLLASYNPETRTTARKATGSFYTPREIVDYMVDEALVARLSGLLGGANEQNLRSLLTYNDEGNPFSDAETRQLIAALDDLRILDPACGSGAFPMGILQKLVHVLEKLDPDNALWKERQLRKVAEIEDSEVRDRTEQDIKQSFERNALGYGRKLFLIEKCIYGVDIQPIAAQITKLRFFISLVVDQQVSDDLPNRGVRPLPNLETKFVVANSLLGITRDNRLSDLRIPALEQQLREVRARHFTARTLKDKAHYRAEDARKRAELAALLTGSGAFSPAHLQKLLAWNPYDQNAVAPFFNPEWMFGITDGFDITIGNPPYVRADAEGYRPIRDTIKAEKRWNGTREVPRYKTLVDKWDLFIPFIELSFEVLKPGGVSSMIVSDGYSYAKYAVASQNHFLSQARILRLDFYGDVQIFEAAVKNTSYLFQKAEGATSAPLRRLHTSAFGNVTLLDSLPQAEADHRLFNPKFVPGDAESHQTRLQDVMYISTGVRPWSSDSAPLSFTTAELVRYQRDDTHPRAWVESKDVRRWLPRQGKFIEWGTRRAPAMFASQTFPELLNASEKLLSKDIAQAVAVVCYDDQQVVPSHTAYCCVKWDLLRGVLNRSITKSAKYQTEDPEGDREQRETTAAGYSTKFVLAVMNSSYAARWLDTNRRSNMHIYPDDWKNLPLPSATPEQQAQIVDLVDDILATLHTGAALDVLEQNLNQLVEALYRRP